MKVVLTRKRRLGEFETMALNKECSPFMQEKLPPKLKDLGSFTIPCTIGDTYCETTLCHLGARINLMPMNVFKKLGIGEVRPTTITLQLVDKSLSHPDGKIEAVLVRVDKFIFPTDFIVLDYEMDREVPIILGRPILATRRTLIDVQKAKLNHEQEEKLLEVLRKFKKAIGWTIADIGGISPSLCMHKIVLEDSEKCYIEGQRRLNPIMKEVMKKEIIKWLDADIIYPISDSSWVSPVQCVPKKGRITVVKNEENKLIPTRIVTGWRICMD
ncbi:uncharacterized protein LOC133799840 [Humulus lupulus]|uniref:uncharacterized protein LOC133799840 n=1 Tax=Humulus lupulus TaxID=3486 RepID=UPI002B406C19|nr:uncharacterized protein LOC133799840 [Humulus lupulus]